MSAKQVPGVDVTVQTAKRVEGGEIRQTDAKLAPSNRQVETRKTNAHIATSIVVCS